jgi:hypothetical protein
MTPEEWQERRVAASLDAIALVEAHLRQDVEATQTILDVADPLTLRYSVAALCELLTTLAAPPDELLAALADWRAQVLEAPMP